MSSKKNSVIRWFDAEIVSEKITEKGIESFSDKELLKLALGDDSSLFSDYLSKDILNIFDGSCEFSDTFTKISKVDGISLEKAIAISAMAEFTRRRIFKSKRILTNPASVFETIKHFFDDSQERFIVVGVNGAGEISFKKVVSIGTLDRALVHPREVFSDAIKFRCSSIFVAHNHPSGNIEPSGADLKTTKRIVEAGEILGIKVLDHIIFSDTEYFSFSEHGHLD